MVVRLSREDHHSFDAAARRGATRDRRPFCMEDPLHPRDGEGHGAAHETVAMSSLTPLHTVFEK